MTQPELLPHLFRTEFSKIAAVLCKRFGIEHIQTAEDIASETFLSALENWSYNGLPENPVAWLYTVARNKAKNQITHDQLFAQKIAPHLKQNSYTDNIEIDLSDSNITDSQLQMLFAICHPSISVEAQIGLALRILCGFGIDEIATAFLTSKETINKRLFRAREKLRAEKVAIEFPSSNEIPSRLEAVLTTLYLLFSEGYYSESNNAVVQKDLCQEAMRLTYLLIECNQTDRPEANALFSLMCFHSSRFDARQNEQGDLILYQDQDETRWDHALISKGAYYLHRAAQGNKLSTFHIEASIAYWHTIKDDTVEKWSTILQLYDLLLQLEYSPIAALNRTYALAKVKGEREAITEAEQLNLSDNHYYHTLLGELYQRVNKNISKLNFQKALSLAKTPADRQTIQKKIDSL